MSVRVLLPRLSERSTRVRLLAWSYEDAATGTDDGGRGSKASSRVPGRNMELWAAGSYAALEHATDRLRREAPVAYRAFWELYAQRDWLGAPEGRILRRVTDWMPANVYVPQDIAEVAGYATSEAKHYTIRRAA